MTQGSKFRCKGENELFNDDRLSINDFRVRKSICGFMVTSYKSYYFSFYFSFLCLRHKVKVV